MNKAQLMGNMELLKSIHEAGHLILSVQKGKQVHSVFIDPADKTGGGVYAKWPDGISEDDKIREEVSIACAGEIAENLIGRPRISPEIDVKLDIIHQKLNKNGKQKVKEGLLELKDNGSIWKEIEVDVSTIIENNEALILAIADRLQKDRKIDGIELDTLLKAII